MEPLLKVLMSPATVVVLSGFVIFGFNRFELSKPTKMAMLLTALIALGVEILSFFVLLGPLSKLPPLVVLSGFVVFGAYRINLSATAKFLLMLFAAITFVISLFILLLLLAFLIPH